MPTISAVGAPRAPNTTATVAVIATIGAVAAVSLIAWKKGAISFGEGDAKKSSSEENEKKDPNTTPITVSRLYVFPVKSLGGMRVKALNFIEGGIEYDREWGVFFADNNNIATQRELPKMKLLRSYVDTKKGILIIGTATGCDDAEAHISASKEMFRIPLAHFDSIDALAKLTNDNKLEHDLDIGTNTDGGYKIIRATDENLRNMDGADLVYLGDKVAKWLTDRIGGGRSIYLARIAPASYRKPVKSTLDACLTDNEQNIRLQDFATTTIVSEEGMAYLAEGLAAEEREKKNTQQQQNKKDSTADNKHLDLIGRLRPNIVVAGAPFPDEDRWGTMRVGGGGGVMLKTARWCSRCALTNVDEDGNANPNKGPTTYLNEHRFLHFPHRPPSAIAKPMFGLSLFHETNGIIRQGDVVTVTSFNDDLPEVKGAKSAEKAAKKS